MADVDTFLTYFRENKLSLSALERMAYRWTIPFFPDDWTIGTNNSVLLFALAFTLACNCFIFSYLDKLEMNELRRKKGFARAASTTAGVAITFCLLGLIIPRSTIYLVETTEPSLASGFYAFKVMGTTAETYEIPLMDDYQITQERFEATPSLSFSKSDLKIYDVFEYDHEKTTLGDYRAFTKTLKDSVIDN